MQPEDILFSYISKLIDLSEEEKQHLRDLHIIRSFPKDTVLVEEGQYCNENYFILKGCIRSYCLVDGMERTTEIFTELEAMIPDSAIDHKPSRCFICCEEDSVLVVSTPEIAEEAMRKFPRFETLCRLISEKLATKVQVDFVRLRTADLQDRYQYLHETRPVLIKRMSPKIIASYLGV